MARQLRVAFEGAIYHVSCRMVGSWQSAENRLFADEADCDRFLEQLAERVEQYKFRRRRRNSSLRAVAARLLVRYAGYTQRDVADHLGIGGGSAVCNQLKRLSERVPRDKRLRALLEESESKLDEKKRLRMQNMRKQEP